MSRSTKYPRIVPPMELSLAAMSLAALLWGGCDFRAELGKFSPSYTGPGNCPGLSPPVDGGAPAPMVCKGGCITMVINRIILPTDSTESERFSLQVGTKKYNSLGGILALLTSQMPEIKLQQDLDLSMDAGRVLNLFRIRPGSGKQSNDSRGQTLVATAQSCCTSKEKPSACKAEALQSCFSGKHPFKVDPKLTAGPPVAGTIKDGTLALGRGDLPLRISYFGSGILDFVLHHASLRGKISSDGITEGVITGALSQYQICNVVIPTAARYFSEQYSDPKADQKTKDLLKTLFDSNKDGKITNAEVATNGLVKTFMDGDMDLDGDGAKELSIGVGFSAVLAKITH